MTRKKKTRCNCANFDFLKKIFNISTFLSQQVSLLFLVLASKKVGVLLGSLVIIFFSICIFYSSSSLFPFYSCSLLSKISVLFFPQVKTSLFGAVFPLTQININSSLPKFEHGANGPRDSQRARGDAQSINQTYQGLVK